MDKISEYLLSRSLEREKNDDYPELSTDEIEEVMNSLGIQDKAKEPAKDVIYKTFKSVKEFKLARTNEEKESAEDNEEYEDYGTVRIKTKSGKESLATLRIKKNDQYGTIIIHDCADEDDVPNAFDTMRIIETSDNQVEAESVCYFNIVNRLIIH